MLDQDLGYEIVCLLKRADPRLLERIRIWNLLLKRANGKIMMAPTFSRTNPNMNESDQGICILMNAEGRVAMLKKDQVLKKVDGKVHILKKADGRIRMLKKEDGRIRMLKRSNGKICVLKKSNGKNCVLKKADGRVRLLKKADRKIHMLKKTDGMFIF